MIWVVMKKEAVVVIALMAVILPHPLHRLSQLPLLLVADFGQPFQQLVKSGSEVIFCLWYIF